MMKIQSKLVIGFIIAALFLFTGIGIMTQFKSAPLPPLAQNGVIDLTQWDFEKYGCIELNGYWEFSWNALLKPSDTQAHPTGYLKVPGAWKGALKDVPLTSKGAGTYRLRIKVNPEYTMYGLKTMNIRMAHALYVNDRLAGNSGIPALNERDYIAGNVPYTAFFPSESEVINIVVLVSDFDYQYGGIVQPVYFGLERDIYGLNLKRIFYDLFAVSTLFMTALYFFVIFLHRRKDLSFLYFAVYCLIFSFFIFTYQEKVLLQMFPSLNYVVVLKVKSITLFICFASACMFINANGEQFLPKKILRLYLGLFMLFALFILLTPLKTYSTYENFMLLIAFSAYLVIGFNIIKALSLKNYGDLGEDGFQLLGLSAFFILINFTGTFLYNLSMIKDNSISLFAIIMFVFTISAFISKRHSKAYRSVEELSLSLIRSGMIKDEFLVNTSHELKTPLHGIINITQTFLDNNQLSIPVKQSENLRYVISIAQRLSSLINDMIDFQHIQSNALHLDKRVLDINAPIQTVLEVYRSMYANKDIVINNLVAHDQFFVLADENRVRQIINTLVGNAMKYTDQGEVSISAVQNNQEVVITVSDSGIGIADDLKEILFEYFEHLSEHRPAEYYSTGLGLSIARKLAVHMGGKLWLDESQMGRGSRFCLTLPAAVPDDLFSLQKNTASGISCALGDESRDCAPAIQQEMNVDYTILVVDDEISNIKVLMDIFANENCNILTAFSGQQALKLIKDRKKQVSLVLLDVMMPQMSGFEVCKRIREKYALFELPVLLLTVKNAPEDIAAGFDSGANDFLSKPFDSRELKARVRTLLELKQSVENSIQAHTAFLQSQIKPHFIFNALSVIMSLCYLDGNQAGRLLGEFSNYLRCSFDFDPYMTFVTLEKELSMVHSYVEIEKARFGDRLTVLYDVDKNLNLSSIPALVVQPLVENAIGHGLMKRMHGGTVAVKVWAEDDSIHITVKDDGVGIPAPKLESLLDSSQPAKGVGLRNIHQRLLNIYGEGLTVESCESAGTIVRLRLPYYRPDFP